MHHSGAFSLHMFFPSGDPDGLKIVKKDNWSGRLIAFRRDQLDDARAREELSATGVYVLRGPEGDPNDVEGVRIYVGQSSTLADRLAEHAQGKEFWTHAVVLTRAGDSLDQADALYLEARLVELARDGRWCFLDNRQQPDPTSMLEPDKEASAEGYLEEVVPCLSALGFWEFEKPMDSAEFGEEDDESFDSDSSREDSVRFFSLSGTRNGISIEAKARRSADGTFEILEGSEAFATVSPSFVRRAEFESYRRLREQVLASDAVVRVGEKYRFVQNVKTGAPSAAEAIVAGRPGSGLANWQEIDISDESASVDAEIAP